MINMEKKYKLIVNLKELYNESFIPKDDLDLYYDKKFIWIAEKKYNEISLYASKILQVIHENTILKNMYENMTNYFIDLKNNKEYFKQAIQANNERITYFLGADANIWEYSNEFTFKFVRFNPKSFFDISNLNIGILNFIYHICCIYKTEYLSGQEIKLVNILHNNFNYRYNIESFDKQESYNDKLCITYDYYFLSKFDDIAYIDTPDIAIFLLIACKRVLYDMLDYLYIVDLSAKEKKERQEVSKNNLDGLSNTLVSFINSYDGKLREFIIYVAKNLENTEAIKGKSIASTLGVKRIQSYLTEIKNSNSNISGLKDLRTELRRLQNS